MSSSKNFINHQSWGTITFDGISWRCNDKKLIQSFDQKTEIIFNSSVNKLTEEKLNFYQITFNNFLDQQDDLKHLIDEKLFEYYQNVYADICEDLVRMESQVLDISDKEKHNELILGIASIEIQDNEIIKMMFNYELDQKHHLVLRLNNCKIEDVYPQDK